MGKKRLARERIRWHLKAQHCPWNVKEKINAIWSCRQPDKLWACTLYQLSCIFESHSHSGCNRVYIIFHSGSAGGKMHLLQHIAASTATHAGFQWKWGQTTQWWPFPHNCATKECPPGINQYFDVLETRKYVRYKICVHESLKSLSFSPSPWVIIQYTLVPMQPYRNYMTYGTLQVYTMHLH